MMFRIVSITAFLITLAGIAIHYIVFPARSGELILAKKWWRPINILETLVFLLTLLLLEQKLKLVGIVRKLVYLLALLCFAVLAVTGFYSPLVSGKPIGGYLLMLHATFAPVLAGCLAILAVMWADNCRLDKNYWPWLQKLLQRETPDKTAGEKYELGQKLSFWIIVFLALPLILSIDASMLPFFGTDWQELLLNAHRYSALLLTLVVIIHIYLTVLARARK